MAFLNQECHKPNVFLNSKRRNAINLMPLITNLTKLIKLTKQTNQTGSREPDLRSRVRDQGIRLSLVTGSLVLWSLKEPWIQEFPGPLASGSSESSAEPLVPALFVHKVAVGRWKPRVFTWFLMHWQKLYENSYKVASFVVSKR